MKRSAFRIYMSLRGTGAGEGTSQAEVPSPEGPLAVWHKLTARPGIEIRLRIPCPRAVFDCVVEPMHGTSPVGFASISGAHWAQGPQWACADKT